LFKEFSYVVPEVADHFIWYTMVNDLWFKHVRIKGSFIFFPCASFCMFAKKNIEMQTGYATVMLVIDVL